MQKTAIIIPCFNEEQRLQPFEFHKQLEASGNLEFFFVNDGSKDKTSEILQKISEESSRCHVVTLKQNKGKAAAVHAGFNAAFKKDFRNIGFWDADLATPLHIIPGFCEFLDAEKVSLVMGSRIKRLGSIIERRIVRHYLGRVFATLVSCILNLPVYDSQCGAKIFRNSDILVQVFSKPFISKWVFDVELIARFMSLKSPHAEEEFTETAYEYPLEEWHDIQGSKLRIKDCFGALIDLYRIKRGMKK